MSDEHVPTYSRYRRGLSPVFGRQTWGYRVTCSCGGYEERINGTKREAESYWRSHRNEASAATRVAVRQEDHVDGNDDKGTTSTAQDPAQTVTTEASAPDGSTATATVTGEDDGSDTAADEAKDEAGDGTAAEGVTEE